MPKPISDQLADLSARAKIAEDGFATNKAAGAAKIQKREAEIEAAANRRSEESRQQYLKAQESMASAWTGLSEKVRTDVADVRAKIDVKKQEHDRNKATHAADQAEDNAMMAIDFAYNAIDYAEMAALDAVIAREKVSSL